MTDKQFTDFVRSLLNEFEGGVYWSPEEIEVYQVVAMAKVLAEFWNHLAATLADFETKSVVMGNRVVDTPATAYKVLEIKYTESGEELPKVPRHGFHVWETRSPGNPIGWAWKGGKFYLFPTPAADLPNFLTVWYMPKLTTLAAFPEWLHPLIAVETLIAGRHKDENVSRALMALHQTYRTAALKATVIPDLQDEHRYSLLLEDE